MNSKKKMKVYGVCIGGMVLLVVAALLLPQIVFAMQDRYQMGNTQVQERAGLSISQVNSVYEKKMYDRMSRLAAMDLNAATVTAIGYDIKEKEELKELLERVFAQDWMALLNEVMGALGHTWEKVSEADIRDCKKYVVYGKDYHEGIALTMWYLDVYSVYSNTHIQLLVDSETDSVYYVKTKSDEPMPDQIYSGGNVAATDASVARRDLLTVLAWRFLEFIDIYGTYYEAEAGGFDSFVEYGRRNVEEGFMDIDEGGQRCAVTFPLSYGELSLDFLFQASYGNDMAPDISMGIPSIGKLIPEML